MHASFSQQLTGDTGSGQAGAADGPPEAPFADVNTAGEGRIHFDVFGWNIGGCGVEGFRDVVLPALRRPFRPTDVLLVQEVPRRRQGWSTQKLEGLTLTSHRDKSQWRGQGILFDAMTWSLTKRAAGVKGVWFKMKLLSAGTSLWLGTFHLTPGISQVEYSAELQSFLDKRPRDGLPFLLQGDANAEIAWSTVLSSVEAVGQGGKGSLLLAAFSEVGVVACPPLPAHRDLPTSRPRQDSRQGHQIDVFGVSRLYCSGVAIHEDSCFMLGTDHELLQGSFVLRGKGRWDQHHTGPRVWKGGPQQITALDQEALERMAKTCTGPRKGQRYQDPPEVKRAFRQAKLNRSSCSWKQALSARRSARRQWEADRLRRATQGDWQAYRGLSRQGRVGWDQSFAEAQDQDPHKVAHEHFQQIFAGKGLPRVPPLTGNCRAFSAGELEVALGQLKTGKSVGVDLTSTELLRAVVQIDGGEVQLLEFMNRVFVEQVVPRSWNKPLLILLPKTDSPTCPKDLRPIALGSSTSKLFARLVMNRIMDYIDHESPAQCAGRGRQAADVLFTVNRVFQLDQEWKQGVCAIKIDISKAFDSVDRGELMAKLTERIGDTFELRALRALLTDTQAILQTAWGSSEFEMGSGIKQGAIESPLLFSFLMDVALAEASQKFSWKSRPKLFEDFEYEEVLYMDDGILWGLDCASIGQRLEEFSRVLLGYGLKLNLGKCRLYCSPHYNGARRVRVGTHWLEAEGRLEIMGVPLAVGQPLTRTLQPLLARARSKFWSISHLLRGKSSIKSRTVLMDKVVSSTALWCIAAFPPEALGLQMVNCFQFILMGWLLKLGKRSQESWVDFRKRVVRSARVFLHHSKVDRWSTQWLRKWWGYAGHRVRSLLRSSPPISAYIDCFRCLEWWNHEKRKKDGLRHPTRFYARLMTMEAKMDKACAGSWRRFAHNRQGWAALAENWLKQQDLPWCSGLQLSVMDATAEG